MNILLSGASGLVGSAVGAALAGQGHRMVQLVRHRTAGHEQVLWDPAAGLLDATALPELDAVVHLAGENVAHGRWTKARKAAIEHSRVAGTALLATTLATAKRPPAVFVAASAIGYYGNRGDELLTEASPPGNDFLAQVCTAWEAASRPLAAHGTRVVALRIGVVLSRSGGALVKMLPAFRAGLGGRLGAGRQWMSWITIDDLVAVVQHVLTDPRFAGPVNATAPNPVTNREFTAVLARTLHRPAIVPVPAIALRLMLGEMAETLLLSSTRVVPQRLLDAGFAFRHPDLSGALRNTLDG